MTAYIAQGIRRLIEEACESDPRYRGIVRREVSAKLQPAESYITGQTSFPCPTGAVARTAAPAPQGGKE